MGWMVLGYFVAYKVSYDLAKKWRRGWLAVVATILGIVGAFVATSGIAAIMHYGNPEVFEAGPIAVRSISVSFFSFIISPISAFFGWRNSRLSNESSSVVETIYSDEKDDLEPEWVNSRDDHIPESENNDETQGIDAKPVKSVHSRRKKLLIGWGVISAMWVLIIPLIGWGNYGHLLTDEIEEVRLAVEIATEREKSPFTRSFFAEPGRTQRHIGSISELFSVNKLKPDSLELVQARKNFPSMNDMTNSKFSDHLWNLAQKEAQKERDYRSEIFKERMLNKMVPMLLFPPITALVLGLIVAWGLRKYPPSEFTPYTKKVIATSAVWVMGAVSWFTIEEGGDLDDVFDHEYVLVYILPPLVLIAASILWKWANKPPADISRQSDVDY